MLIHLDFTEQDIITCDQSVLGDCLTELLRAHRRGHHIAVIPRLACDRIAKLVSLSEREAATLVRIRSDFSQSAGLLRSATIYLRIVPQSSHGTSVPQNSVTLDLETARNSRIFDRAILIVEDQVDDGEVYIFCLMNSARHFGVPHVTVEVAHGGGSRISEILAAKMDERRIACALIDSDARSPHSPIAEKLRVLNRLIERSSWQLAFSRVLPCREIENVLSVAVLEVIATYKNQPLVENLKRIQKSEYESACLPSNRFFLYADLKEGLRPEKFSSLKRDDEKLWIKTKCVMASIDPL